MDSPSIHSPVELAFARFLARKESGGGITLEEFCREHPELADGLRALHADWRRFEELRGNAGVDAHASERPLDTLRRKYGAQIDPGVSLEGAAPMAHPLTTSELLERLQARGASGSRYRILGELARGGMGAILRIWDEDLRRSLAMKVILGRGGASIRGDTPEVAPRTLGRFLEEAQITGQLDHPGIVPVHELGLAADGRVYFTMRLVRGIDLRRVFELAQRGEEGWSQTRALGVLLKVCEAMSYAHDKGVLHRDLKPANVMVGKYGEVYVMDWGLARVLGEADRHDLRFSPDARGALGVVDTERRDEREATPASPLVTMDGDVVGTPAYMPPEQARGRLGELGPWSDVYSVGALLYHLLSQRAPYASGTKLDSPHAVLARSIAGPPTPIAELAPDAPRDLVAICDKAMSREPAQRYPSMSALADDLRAYLEGRVVVAYERGAWAEARKWVRRNRTLSTAMAASLVLLIGLLVGGQELRAETQRSATLEREKTARALALRLKDIYLQLFDEPAVPPEMSARGVDSATYDAEVYAERVAEAFADAGFAFERGEDASDLGDRLRAHLGADHVAEILPGIYDFARSAQTQPPSRAQALPDDSALALLWPGALVVIDRWEDDAWRKATWKLWLETVRASGNLPKEFLEQHDDPRLSASDLEWLAELGWAASLNAETKSLLDRAVQADPSLFVAHFRLGLLGGSSAGQDAQMHHDRVAVALEPRSSAALFNLGWACQARADKFPELKDEAIRSYREAIRISPRLSRAYANLSLLVERADGIGLLEQSLELNGPHHEVLANLEFLSLEAHEPARCEKAARIGIASFPTSALHPYHLGRALDDLGGRTLEAAEAYTAAAELDPTMWSAWSNSAGTYLTAAAVPATGSPEQFALAQKALASARRAYELRPDDWTSILNLVGALAGTAQVEATADVLEKALSGAHADDARELLIQIRDEVRAAGDGPEFVERVDRLLESPESK